jgi:hypothetical protein
MEQSSATSVGLLPIGALSVAFYHYLTSPGSSAQVQFLGRRGGGKSERWGESSSVRVETKDGIKDLLLAGLLAGNLPEAAAAGRLPSVVLVCTNPDQLLDVIADFVAVVEYEHRQGHLLLGTARLPALVLCSNGIYFQRVRSSLVEMLEESTLLGRLPDLWPELMPGVVGRMMRGVTIQTALRRGGGSSAVYRPGPRGRTLLTGGDRVVRQTVVAELSKLGVWFEDAGTAKPTRVEFDKAIINLAMNVFGQLSAIDSEGRFRALTVGDITRSVPRERILELVTEVMKVGNGVGVFLEDESPAATMAELQRQLAATAAHVPSSLQMLEQQILSKTLAPGLGATEKWLLQPLQQYSRSLGDERAITYFEAIEKELTAAIARAVAANNAA